MKISKQTKEDIKTHIQSILDDLKADGAQRPEGFFEYLSPVAWVRILEERISTCLDEDSRIVAPELFRDSIAETAAFATACLEIINSGRLQSFLQDGDDDNEPVVKAKIELEYDEDDPEACKQAAVIKEAITEAVSKAYATCHCTKFASE